MDKDPKMLILQELDGKLALGFQGFSDIYQLIGFIRRFADKDYLEKRVFREFDEGIINFGERPFLKSENKNVEKKQKDNKFEKKKK